MPPVRKVRKINKCQSCRRLKIKCDEAKPRCEYCEATNKQCIYDGAAEHRSKNTNTQLLAPNMNKLEAFELGVGMGIGVGYGFGFTDAGINDSTIDINKLAELLQNAMGNFSVDNLVQENQLMICHMYDQLKINKFEWGLLKFFTSYYLKSNLYPHPFPAKVNELIMHTVHKSFLFRVTTLGLCSMCLFAMKANNNGALIEEFNQYDLDYLYVKSLEYFQLTMKSNQNRILNMIEGRVIDTLDELFELLFSDIFTFFILVLQPFDLVPMIGEIKGSKVLSNDAFKSTPNVVSICQGMKALIGYALRHIESLKEGKLFSGSPLFAELQRSPSYADYFDDLLLLYPPISFGSELYEMRFPLPKMLLQQLKDWRKMSSRQREYQIYRRAISALDGSMGISMNDKTTVGLLRWIFLWDHNFFPFIEIQEFASLKLLFYYCCFCCYLNVKNDNGYSEGANYVEVFKDISFKQFGGWHHSMDEDMYDLVQQNFKLDDKNMHILRDFMPGDYSIKKGVGALINTVSSDEEWLGTGDASSNQRSPSAAETGNSSVTLGDPWSNDADFKNFIEMDQKLY